MKKNILTAAIVIVILAAAGIYFVKYYGTPTVPGTGGQGSVPPASIKIFHIEKPNFVARGENLSRLEIWAVQGGAEKLVGTASMTAGSSVPGLGDTWTLPVPAGLKGASEVFARGYDKSGNAAAKIGLSPADLKSL